MSLKKRIEAIKEKRGDEISILKVQVKRILDKLATIQEGAEENIPIVDLKKQLEAIGIEAKTLNGSSWFADKVHSHSAYQDREEAEEWKQKITTDVVAFVQNFSEELSKTGARQKFLDDGIGGLRNKIENESQRIRKEFEDLYHGNLKGLRWSEAGHTIDSDIDLKDNAIKNLKDPEKPKDAANKRYVDSKLGQAAQVRIIGGAGTASNLAASILGNTLGTPSLLSSGTMYLAGGPNITLSQDGSTITISGGAGGPGGGGIALFDGANSITSGTVRISNSNGISFGINGQTLTLSHNGLTTARASNDAIGLNTALTGNGVSWTVNSSGISLNVPAFLTTAMQSNAATISNVRVSAGTTSNLLSAITFANSNGISFGLNAGTITASASQSVQTQGMVSLNGSTGNISIVTGSSLSSSVNGSTITFGLASNITTALQSAGAYLTTAAVSNHSHGASGANGSFAFQTLSFSNANGVSFGTSAGSAITASHNALTTARASNDAIGLNTAQTNVTWTVNSGGLSLNAGGYAGTTSGFGGNSISGSITHNSVGINLSLNHPAWLTTAMQSNAATLSNIRVSAGTTSNLLSAITFSNSNGVSFGLNAGTMTASHNGLTTARASNDAIGLNTAQSNVTWTVNSGGLSLDARNYAGTGTTFNGANISASITQNSAGVQISASVAAPGAGGGAAISAGANSQNTGTVNFANSNGITFGLSNNGTMTASFSAPAVSNSAGSFTFQTLNFSNANNVTFGTSAGNVVTASVAAPGAAAENNWMTLLGANVSSNSSASGSTIGLSGSNITLAGTNNSQIIISAPATSSLQATGIVSISTNGSTISVGAAMTTLSSYYEGLQGITLLHAGANAKISVERLQVNQYVSASMIGIPIYQSLSSSAVGNTYGQQWSIYAMVLTNDTANNRLMSLSSGSTQTTYTMASNNAGATQIIGSGVRPLTVPININMTPGIYYMAFNLSTNTFSSGTATTALNRTASFIGRGPLMSASFGMVSAYNVATGNTVNRLWPQGVVSGGASAGIPATISHSQITMTGLSHSQANLAFYMQA